MSFKSYNKLTKVLMGEIPYERKKIIYSKIAKLEQKLVLTKKFKESEKIESLNDILSQLHQKKNSLADLISMETGKYKENSFKEIYQSMDFIQFAMQDKFKFLKTQNIKTNATKKSLVQFNPLGIIFSSITNYKPLWHILRIIVLNAKIGNVTLIRPGQNSPVIAKCLEEILHKDFPFSDLIYNDPKNYETIIKHPSISGVYFSGDYEDSQAIASLCGKHLKPSIIESGSNNPMLILDEKSIKKAVEDLIESKIIRQIE